MSSGKNDERKSIEAYGIIFVSGEIDTGAAEKICQEIIRINLERPSDHIQMLINSAGGQISAGFAIIDMMEWSSLPVYTTGIGLIASMALAVFMAGKKGRRVLTPHTSILSHRFFGMSMGSHSELLARRKEEDFLHQRLIDHYINNTNLTTCEEVEHLLLKDVDTWLTPDEAVSFGIADIIHRNNKTEE